MKTINLLFALLLSIAVAACGGGSSGGGTAAAITATPISATATTTAQSLNVGTAMASFSPLTPNGGATPYTYSIASGILPAGLSLDASTGVVTGTPTATYTTANVIFSVKDANNIMAATTSTVSFTVAATIPLSATANTTAQNLTVGTAMASFVPLTPNGGATPYTYSIASGILPAGLSLDASTGVVTGTPTATYTTANVIFSVKDANNVMVATTSTVSFTVAAAIPLSATANTTTQSLNVGTAMASFVPLTASGGATPYTYSITAGTLPAGLNLNAGTGVVTGTPTATYTTANVTFSVKDANNVVASTTSTVGFTVVRVLNDTGITANQCYQAGSDVLVACNSAGALALNNAQDGMVGRDANAVTNSNTDGKLGFSYSAVTGGCVLDNITGLMWEVKTTDGGLRDWNKTYTNYDSTSALQKWNGVVYVAPTQLDIDASTNSVGFVTAVNATNLCGYSDWRLPTADELQSIVDYSVANPGPTVDTTWFPNTQVYYWSASPDVSYPSGAWDVDFVLGYSVSILRSGGAGGNAFVRLVRAGQSPVLPRYTVSANGQEVTDNQTNLIWRRCAEGMVYSGGTCTGTAGTFTHETALQLAATQASSTGVAWRLPNIKELSSIADKSRVSPAIDPAAFPATPANLFWSASPCVTAPMFVMNVNFGNGGVGYGTRTPSQYVRLVRSGQ